MVCDKTWQYLMNTVCDATETVCLNYSLNKIAANKQGICNINFKPYQH